MEIRNFDFVGNCCQTPQIFFVQVAQFPEYTPGVFVQVAQTGCRYSHYQIAQTEAQFFVQTDNKIFRFLCCFSYVILYN